MSSPNQISRPTKEEVAQQERERAESAEAAVPGETIEPGTSVRRQPQQVEDLARRRRIEREEEEAELDEQQAVAREAAQAGQVAQEAPRVARSAPELGDEVFASSDTEPPAPNTQPPTLESQAATLSEASRRAKAVDGALRDEAVRDRLFSEDNAELTAAERVAKLTGRQRQYAQLMVLNCAKPLAQGIDGDTLTTTVTSAAIVWALSPQFRALMNEYADPIHKALREHRESAKKENSKVPLGSSPTKAAAAKAAAERKDAELLAGVKAVLDDPEGVPFSTDSAAQMLVQVHEDAYVAVRQGRDYDQVMGEMDETVTELEKVFDEQSLKPVEIRERARRLLGERAGTDPATLSQFIETANGRVRMTPHEGAGAGGVGVATWDGRWQVDRGGLLKSSGLPMFTVRPVMTVDEHIAAVRKLVSDDLASAVREGTRLGEVHEGKLLHALSGHHLAWDLRDTNLGVAGAAGASPNPALAAAQRARLAYGAMVDDGLTPEVRHAIAGVGLEQGLEQFLQEHPEMAHVVEKYRSPEHQGLVDKLRAHCLDNYPQQPLAPIVAEPANPLEAKRLELLGVDPGEPEAARDLGTKPVQECVLGPWGPRPSQEHLDAQLEQQLSAERAEAQSRTLRREAPEHQVAEPYGPDRTGRERRPAFGGRGPQRDAAPGQSAQADAPPWTVVTQAQNNERKAKGMPEVNRVPAGFPAVPADNAALEREQQQRQRLESAPAWTIVTEAQNLERERKGMPRANRVPHGMPGVPGDKAALERERAEIARREKIAARVDAARAARDQGSSGTTGAPAGVADAGAATAAAGDTGSASADAAGQGRHLQPRVPEASPAAPGAKDLPVGGREAVIERREQQARSEQAASDRQVWTDQSRMTDQTRQKRAAETMRKLRNERNRRRLDPERQPEV